MRTSLRIKRIRTRLQLTQEQMAQRIGVSFTTVNRWEKGHNKPLPEIRNLLKELESEANKK